MGDATSKNRSDVLTSSTDAELDALLRAVAHAPPRRPPQEPVLAGTRWGAAGRYVIEERLGRGGMGTVYSATDTLLNRTVALKVLDLGSGDDESAHRDRLLREARLAARFEHERIARVYDVGEQEGFLFVAMELVRGVTLRSWMKGRAAAPAEIIAVTTQIAEGLGALHANGIFHRDLKPENVMLSEQGAVRLVDFGLARAATHGEAPEGPAPSGASGDGESTGALSGTPGYMAPEQCAGAPLDARVDVFALGVVVYELVTGDRPFAGDDHDAIVAATIRCAPDFSGPAWSRVPPALSTVAQRLLARDPAERIADGNTALQALRGVVLPLVVPAEPTTVTAPAPSSAEHEALAASAPQPLLPALASPGPGPASPDRRWKQVAATATVATTLAIVAVAAAVHRAAPPRAPPLAGMAWIDVGTIDVGRSPADLDRECAAIGAGCDRELMQREVPSKRVTLTPFQLDMYEVTNEEMVATLNTLRASLYVAEGEADHYPRYVRWAQGLASAREFLVDLYPHGGGIDYLADHTFQVKPGFARLPVVQVTWHGASLFCATRGKFLPTEDEWEAAARGRTNRPFPWGDAPPRCGEVIVPRDGLIAMPAACPAKVELTAIGQAAQDVTAEGIHDLGGNAAEWVDAVYTEGNRAAEAGAGTGAPERPKVFRGGSFAESLMARSSGRNRRIANVVATNLGFRCAVR